MVHQVLVHVLVASVEMRMVNDLIAILLLQFGTGILARLVIIQMAIHMLVVLQQPMYLLHIRHRVEDDTVLTTTDAEHDSGEVVHKAFVQMANLAVSTNQSDVLWRHAPLEETVAYLVATAVVLEADGKELFAIVTVFHLTTETACNICRYSTLTQVLSKCRMAQRFFHNIAKWITFCLYNPFFCTLMMQKRCRKTATESFRNELGLRHKLVAVDELPGKIEDVAASADTVIIPDILVR